MTRKKRTTTTTAAPVEELPRLPLPVWRSLQERTRALGLRLDLLLSGEFVLYRLKDGQEHNRARDLAGLEELLQQMEAYQLDVLCRRAEGLGARIDREKGGPHLVEVMSPPTFPQMPLMVAAADLLILCQAWERNQAKQQTMLLDMDEQSMTAKRQAMALIDLLQTGPWADAQQACCSLARTMGVLE